MAGEISGPPEVNFYAMLSGLGDTIQANRKEAARKAAYEIATSPGPDGKIDFGKAILGLQGAGDHQAAQLFAQLQAKQEAKLQSDRDFAFKQDESRRAQQNADRSYGLQVRTANRADEDKPIIKEITDPNTGATTLVRVNPRGPVGPIDTGVAVPSAPLNPFAYGKQNENQSKDSGYANRMFEAEQVLRDPKVQQAATSYGQYALENTPVVPDVIKNKMLSPEYQKFDQAKRNFVNAVLRRESGAAISESEFNNAYKQYFPQPGDSAEKIAEKQRNRQDTLAGIAGGGGQSYRPPFTFGPNGELVPTGSGKQGAAKPLNGGKPIPVKSPEQARMLPSGTPIILPDGSPGVVP